MEEKESGVQKRRRGGIISLPEVNVTVDGPTPQQERLKYERKNTK